MKNIINEATNFLLNESTELDKLFVKGVSTSDIAKKTGKTKVSISQARITWAWKVADSMLNKGEKPSVIVGTLEDVGAMTPELKRYILGK